MKPKCDDTLSLLWTNSLIFLTILCQGSGSNFEDFERYVWAQNIILVSRISELCKPEANWKCREAGLAFMQVLLKRMLQKEKQSSELSSIINTTNKSHPLLCEKWTEMELSFGSVLCKSLLCDVYESSLKSDEKETVLTIMLTLICLCPSAKLTAVQSKKTEVLIGRLENFGLKYCESIETKIVGKKVAKRLKYT